MARRGAQAALRAATADRRGALRWDVDHAGWVVGLLSPDRERFRGRTLEEALAWCLVRLMADGWGWGRSRDAPAAPEARAIDALALHRDRQSFQRRAADDGW